MRAVTGPALRGIGAVLMAKAPPIKLVWLEAVIDRLCEDMPTNHSPVLALATVLVRHAKRDGTSIWPAQATMARESGLRSWSTLHGALKYLLETGLLTEVRKRARGVREYRLTFPGDDRQILNERASDDQHRSSLSEHLEADDGKSDPQSDPQSPTHSPRTNPVTPLTPRRTHQREPRSSGADIDSASGDGLWSTLDDSVKLRHLMSLRGDSRESVQAAVRKLKSDKRWKDHSCAKCADGRPPYECPILIVNAIVASS